MPPETVQLRETAASCWKITVKRNGATVLMYHHLGFDPVEHVLTRYPNAEIEFEGTLS